MAVLTHVSPVFLLMKRIFASEAKNAKNAGKSKILKNERW
jgi:hypothetical protein